MKNLTRFLSTVSVACVALSAQAAPTIVTEWSYDLSSLWTAAAPAGVTGVGTQTLAWGTPAGPGGQSQLVISGDVAGGSVDTFVGAPGPIPPAFFAAGNALTHNNQPIIGASLTGATLTATLSLDAVMPDGVGPGGIDPLIVNIGFAETPNQEPCAVDGSPTPCNDIFVLIGGLLNQSFTYDVDGTGDVTYFVNVFPTSGGVLSFLDDDECIAAGQAPGCFGFSTPEGESTTLAFGFTISTSPFLVPEPGVLALTGLALLGAGLARRRRI
ncbi:MAG: THxN family PEP-CTERM protein [Pseudomonadota bacterium]